MENQRQRQYNYRKCAICGARKVPKSNTVFSSFPLDSDRCRLWVKATGDEDLIHLPIEKLHELKYICGSHFVPEFFNDKRNRLLKTAVPTERLTRPPLSEKNLNAFPLHVKSFYEMRKKASGTMRKIPPTMKLGVATAAYQIEGGWNAGGRTPCVWDTVCHMDPSPIKDKTTGDDACKSYEFYERDIQMLKFLGVDFYRFSISWSRILPSGFANKINEDGVAYYSKIIDLLLENNIEPAVTVYHWDLPQSLQDLGGWANPHIVDWFGDYARVLYRLFGDRVKKWITINEPKQFGVYGYGTLRMAPRLNAHGIGEYLAAKNIVLAHARAWHIYDKEFRPTQKGVCGITIATDYRQGLTDSPEHVELGLEVMDFDVGLYAHPIFTEKGGFPERVIKRIAAKSKEQGYPRSRLPEFTQEEIEYCKGTSDFYGFNHYSTRFYSRDNFKPGTFPIPSYDDDIGGDFTYLDYETGAVPHCTIIPIGIRRALNFVKHNYNNPPIMITENGFGTFGGMNDLDRISYYKRYLDAVLDAVEIDGCNVIAYTAWSLMDNFEWDCGLGVKFGLFEVDYDDENKQRTARTSALWYKDFVTRRCLDEYIPNLEEIKF